MNLLLFLQNSAQDTSLKEAIKADPMGWTTYLVPITYYFFIIICIITVVWSIYNLSKNPAALKKFGIGLGVLLIIFLIFWAIAPSAVPEQYQGLISSKNYKLVGGGILTAVALAFIGIFLIIIDIVRSSINKS